MLSITDFEVIFDETTYCHILINQAQLRFPMARKYRHCKWIVNTIELMLHMHYHIFMYIYSNLTFLFATFSFYCTVIILNTI